MFFYYVIFLICIISKNAEHSKFAASGTTFRSNFYIDSQPGRFKLLKFLPRIFHHQPTYSFNTSGNDRIYANKIEVESENNSVQELTKHGKPDTSTLPHFSNTTEREVIAAVGTTASFQCRVRNLGDRAVSWIRKRDLHILTIGIMTYTNDQRFLTQHISNSDLWVLHILSVQQRDAGIYECQVSTESKISQAFKLHVVTSRARILANREIFIQIGSNINLTCIAPQAPGPYTHMVWYKDNELISDLPRGGIRVISEQMMKTINLIISRAMPEDSGNYTCAANSSNSDSVLVHIIQSEKHAAMQREASATTSGENWLFVSLILIVLCVS